MFRLGLTGGVGSGKSTVAALLAKAGAGVVDADAISRQVTAAGGSAIDPLRKMFGSEYIALDGGLDRAKVRELVFSDPQARKKLETIVHPLIQQTTGSQTQALLQAGCPCVVFDVPLLVESSHWRRSVDKVLVIDCAPETQIQRTTQRSGLTADAVVQIMSAQASREFRLSAADWVLCNDHLTLIELAIEVRLIAPDCGL